MVPANPLWGRVLESLRGALSPEQASGILRRMPDPVRISHEAIYTALYAMPLGELRAQILALRPRGHKTCRPRSAGTDRRGLIPGAVSIDERPIEVSERLVPGHWEGDLIKGARNQSQIGTLVERKTLLHGVGSTGQRRRRTHGPTLWFCPQPPGCGHASVDDV